jgi:exopolysaccharide production protein ExoZ
LKTTTKLNNIQVLRAFAATAVVVFHTGFAFPFMRPFGSFGVDVFFVISGYIMARILDPESESSSDFFFRRRVLRIVPPYWFFTILLYIAALRFPQLMGSTRAGVTDLIKSLFFIPFTKGSGLIQPLLFIGWSLNYEMFFYLALAIGLLIHKRKGIWLGAGIVLATLLFCQIALATFASQNVFAQFYGRDISVEFLLGILSYYLCRAVSVPRARALRWVALAVCSISAILLIAMQGILPREFIPFAFSRIPNLGVLSFLLVTSASLLSQANWDTRLASLVLIGDASYILYLIHPYCEYFLDRVFGAHYHWLKSDSATGALVGVTVSIVLAILAHLYGERPTVRFLNRNFGGKRKSTEFANPA